MRINDKITAGVKENSAVARYIHSVEQFCLLFSLSVKLCVYVCANSCMYELCLYVYICAADTFSILEWKPRLRIYGKPVR